MIDPPNDIQGEARAEWFRICAELPVENSDRALLVVYCQTWEIYHRAMQGVSQHGAIVKFPNGVPGQSPFYKVSRETANQLHKLLIDLGATPTARHKMKAIAEPVGNLVF